MPTSTPRGWFLGLALVFTCLASVYSELSQQQREQAWQVEQLRQELSETRRELAMLQAVVKGHRAQAHAQTVDRRLAGQLTPGDVDLVAARVVSWMERGGMPAEAQRRLEASRASSRGDGASSDSL